MHARRDVIEDEAALLVGEGRGLQLASLDGDVVLRRWLPVAAAKSALDRTAGAQSDAAEVHEAAVEGEQEAESLAEDVAEPESEPEPESETESESEPEAEPEIEAEPEAEVAPEEGLGSVDGGEVAEAQGDAAEVHDAAVEDAAVEGEQEAESLAEEVAAEAEPEDTPETEPAAPESTAPRRKWWRRRNG